MFIIDMQVMSLNRLQNSPPFIPCASSCHYPWVAREHDEHEPRTPHDHGHESSVSEAPTSSSTAKADQQSDNKKDNETKFRIHHYFDYVAGTSTGGYVTTPMSLHAP